MFFEPNSILPLLFKRLGAPDLAIGSIRLFQLLGITLPGLFVAHYIHGRRYHRSFLMGATAIGRVGLLTFPPLIALYALRSPHFVVAWMLAIYPVFWLLNGATTVSWLDIIGKSIPARARGRFFGAIQLLSGLLGMVAAWVAGWIAVRSGIPYPLNFALLAALWCLGIVTSQTSFFFLREPEGGFETEEARPPLGEYLRRALPALRGRPQVVRLIAIRILLDSMGLAAPFYILYAQNDLHTAAWVVALCPFILAAGKVSAGPVWGWLADHFGAVVGLRAVAATIALAPIVALAAAGGSVWVFPAVFFLLGSVQDTMWMFVSNALMEAAPDNERGFTMGAAGMLMAPGAAYGVIGGLVADHAGYHAVFVLTLVFGLTGLALTLGTRARERQ